MNVYPKSVILDPLVAVFVAAGWAKDAQLVPAEQNEEASEGPSIVEYM